MHSNNRLPHIRLELQSNETMDYGIMSDRLSSMICKNDIQKVHVFLYNMAHYCSQQSTLHSKCRIQFKYYNYGLSIPAILLSTIAGSVSTMTSFNENSQSCAKNTMHWIGLMCGIAGVVAASMLSIHRFCNFAELESKHSQYSDSFEYENLAIRSNILLDMGGENRTFTNLYEYLKHCRNEVSMLIEKAPNVSSHVKNRYKRKKKIVDVEQIFDR